MYPSCLYVVAILSEFFEHPDHQFLNSASNRLVISICLVLFLGCCSALSFLCFLNMAASLCLFLCFRRVLGRAVLTPCVSSMVYCRKGTWKLCGAESVIARTGQPTSPLCGFVWRRAQRRDSATAWLLKVCSALALCDWCPSSCCPGAKSQKGLCTFLRPCRPFKWSLLKIRQFSCHPTPTLTGF